MSQPALPELETLTMMPLGDSAVMIRFTQEISPTVHGQVWQLTRYLNDCPFVGFLECVPGYASIGVYYDSSQTTFAQVEAHVGEGYWTRRAGVASTDPDEIQICSIPVCYGGEFGPDLEEVAAHCGLSLDEVIQLHSQGIYSVYMIGFTPGFAYLGGLPEEIMTPRKAVPRRIVPTGSVGIAGQQTGVYPVASPGGWQIIGRTPVPMLRLGNEERPSLLRVGDIVRFSAISTGEFERQWETDRKRS